MALISIGAPLGATAQAVDVSAGHTIASGAGYALIIYSRDFAEWSNPSSNYLNMEPWIAAIVHRLAAYTSDAADETANVTIGSATIGSSNRNGSLKERETRTMQIYGAEITSTSIDPDDL